MKTNLAVRVIAMEKPWV
jgi:hypothetical protein